MSLVERFDCGGPRLLHEFHRSHNHLFGLLRMSNMTTVKNGQGAAEAALLTLL